MKVSLSDNLETNMINRLLKKLFGTRNNRELARLERVVNVINTFEASFKELSNSNLAAKTKALRERLLTGEDLDHILPEAFAVVREVSWRTLGLRHFDVQLIGGIGLYEGKIAEMRTGEGKTLMSTLPAYLNALNGNSVHIVTVNDYLAQRDANWMKPIYEFLGISVGVITSGQSESEKRAAYQADIIYGTNNEFGFDYLRDNMAFSIQDKLQSDLSFAIVDEVDSILIDEARTPLVISGASEGSSDLYKSIDRLMPKLKKQSDDDLEGHFIVDEKLRQIELTEDGHALTEELLIAANLLEEGESLYAPTNLTLLHHIHSALRAHNLFKKDVEYIIKDGRIVLIDEHTGRTMEGRRLSEGLHQALEAKEGVQIQKESQTLASITFQNYFRQYSTLSGMTGTADTEAFEFKQIYGLEVLVIPTNVQMIREDMNDLVFLSREEKYDAIIADVQECISKQAPVLVGTASVETSEELSLKFKQTGIEHKVLNAKYHAQEAEIIAQAGRPGMVTIATNMAGRGTDIVLGGNLEVELKSRENISEGEIEALTRDWKKRHEKVLDVGGLHVLGTERHESRRIDNQLRGRAGRQGDPGVSRFYLSLDDNLMRIFASEKVKNFMQALGMDKGEAIEHKLVTNSIEKAQKKVESRNFDIRKQLLEYDDVANDQRQVIYQQRNNLLEEQDISETIKQIRIDVVNQVIDSFIPPMSIEEQWDIKGLEKQLEQDFTITIPIELWLDSDEKLHEESLRVRICDEVQFAYDSKCNEVGRDILNIEKQVMLQILDTFWKEHLALMDQLRQGIHLRAYAQKNPKQEYKRESFALFEELLENVKYEVIKFLSNVEVSRENESLIMARQRRERAEKENLDYHHAVGSEGSTNDSLESVEENRAGTFTREQPKVGRNQPCPCGSGKKYKHCCGSLVSE